MIQADPASLELSPDTVRAISLDALDRIVAHLATMNEQPARGNVQVQALCRALRETAPEDGAAIGPLLDSLFNDWIPSSFTTPGPGYLAYIPGGGLFPAALADFISASTNRYTGVWMAAPALVQLEANVLDWLRDWMLFPPTTRGLLTTGGSMAGFNAIVCARERLLGNDIRSGVLYTSTQAHHSIAKAARLAGIMPDRVRSVQADGAFRMDVDVLMRTIARGSGIRPEALHGGVHRRNDQHRRGRPAGRHRRPVRGRGPVASRRRRLRRLLPHVPRAAPAAARPAPCRLTDPRSAQGSLPAVRDGRAARPRRFGAARGAWRDCGVSARDA